MLKSQLTKLSLNKKENNNIKERNIQNKVSS